MAGSTQYRFGVLAKIVKHMRIRHLDGDDHPLTLDDILDETNQLDIGSSVKNVCVSTVIGQCRIYFEIKTEIACHYLVCCCSIRNSGYKQKLYKIIQK